MSIKEALTKLQGHHLSSRAAVVLFAVLFVGVLLGSVMSHASLIRSVRRDAEANLRPRVDVKSLPVHFRERINSLSQLSYAHYNLHTIPLGKDEIWLSYSSWTTVALIRATETSGTTTIVSVEFHDT